MNTPTPYLNFPGTCEEAFDLYARIFGGTIDFKGRFKEMPPEMQVPPGFADKIMHISMSVDGKPFLFGSDAPEGYGDKYTVGTNVQLSLNPANDAEARRVYDGLREGGQVTMELAPTFWAQLFGMVRDRYGVCWMISYGQPQQ